MSYPKPSIVLCTVGTSLFAPNLKALNPEKYIEDLEKKSEMEADFKAIQSQLSPYSSQKLLKILNNLSKAYQEKQWKEVAKNLVLLPPSVRLQGAEINSTEGIIRKGFLDHNRYRIVLLVSETQEGKEIGEILQAYFSHKNCSIAFENCEYKEVEGIQDANPLEFQKKGLASLVKILGEHLRKWGSESLAINATGGYKAQIALAVAFGQATHCPVFYKHERFDQIIRFPQIPFTLDLSFIGNHLKIWADLAEYGKSFTLEELNKLLGKDQSFRDTMDPMIESIEENGEPTFALASLGMVYWEAYRQQNPTVSLEPDKLKKSERKGCHFRDDHYPKGFKEYVEKVYNAFPKVIIECHSLPYTGQAGIKNCFYSRQKQLIGEHLDKDRFGGRFEIIGEYLDKDHFGGRFAILTKAKNELERNWVLEQLNSFLDEN
jgi:putative CRISPR-associated protein (TIGR02619 family)